MLQLQFHQKENGYTVLVKTCEDIMFIATFIHAVSECLDDDPEFFYFSCRNMYCFSQQSGKLEHLMKVCRISQMKIFTWLCYTDFY